MVLLQHRHWQQDMITFWSETVRVSCTLSAFDQKAGMVAAALLLHTAEAGSPDLSIPLTAAPMSRPVM